MSEPKPCVPIECGPVREVVVDSIQMMFNQHTTVTEAIQQAIGAASMCWEHPEGAGEFRPDWALQIATQLERFLSHHAG